MTQLGFGYTASFYRYVQRSSNELVFVHRESNEIQSACVLSVAAASLGRRLCRHTPLVLFLLGGWFNPRLRAAGQAILGSGECGATGYSQAPELIFIFTAVERRGAGFASALIERCERYLSALGYDSYVARTAINVSPETLRFYRRHGFACSRRTGEGGQFYLLEKCLNTLKR